MAPPRWSRTDVLWIVAVMGIYAGVCRADAATDGNILTDGISETSTEKLQHTSPPIEDRGQGALTSEFSTLAVSGTLSSKTTTSENSEITTGHYNKNSSETMETTIQQIGDNQVVEPGKDVPADTNANNSGERSGTPTYIKNVAGQRGQNIVAAVGSIEDSKPTEGSGRIIHVILFTNWQMIVALIGLEVFAYCITIFIIFGFGRQRSRAKRFGHFSWKRPGPLQLEQETSFSTITSREHRIGGTEEPLMRMEPLMRTEPLMKTEPPMKTKHKGMMKKPSVRGHRP